MHKLDILALGAHPDDVDACAGGTLIASINQGMKVGIVDLTAGDNAETGSGSIRIKEAQDSANIMGVQIRENLELPERNFVSTDTEDRIVSVIRKYQPETIIMPHWHDRHKGHRDASVVIERAVQLAKYSKVNPSSKAHKVKKILYYMIHYEFEPSFIFDISQYQDQKMAALMAHKSQMLKQNQEGAYLQELNDAEFIEAWNARSRWYGYISGVKFGEAFQMRRPTGINNLNALTNLFR